MAGYVDKHLELNGRRGDHDSLYYRRFTLPTDPATPFPYDVFDKIMEFKPHIIVSTGGDEFVREIMSNVEAAWPYLVGSEQPPPFYVLSPFHVTSYSRYPEEFAMPGLLERIAGINIAAAEDTTLYDQYLRRLLAANVGATYPLDGAENFYDAVYFLLFAAAAAGNPQVLSGTTVAQGMTRLLEGPRYDVDPAQIPQILGYLKAPGNRLSLYGTLGPPDFDPQTGARAGLGSVYCFQESNGAITAIFDTLRYSKVDDSLSGNFACVDGL
jgi:hypothetical protein